ncbi:NAD-dependent epimerase/dehydratase family protein [Azospirillum griseum]|uniref:NAD(P)-dependent oxidoreductase n=1 Tax=Azospirillum griseum TaxID=2496639 RepID=A0A3S0ICS4_9PROT|nr:NAD(P)-dependent oxidoreductase [Azospirillum griseum]RTR16878.1 NAD(P)-dependent oxidoreductase [Azospirillum griseum]
MLLLMTGAGGAVATALTPRLTALGYRLRFSDRVRPAGLPDDADFVAAELTDEAAVFRACDGVDAVLHLGAISSEDSFERILEVNIRGSHHVFEGARRAGNRRVIFASSNHAIGMYPRSLTIDETAAPRPDSYYGLSKAYGELLARFYWDKHGLESACLRIGSSEHKPSQKRHLSTWLSHDDFAHLIDRCLKAEGLGAAIFYGVSANSQRWWRDQSAQTIGYHPQDNAEACAGLPGMQDPMPNALDEAHQGGTFVSANCTRTQPPDERWNASGAAQKQGSL